MLDQRLVTVGRLFYERHLSKTDIARQLGISVTHVGRLLKEATKLGVVKISINSPGFERLELELKDAFGLRDVSVVLADEASAHVELGRQAANYFEREIRSKQSVGLGSGRTLFEMVSAIEQKTRDVDIYPLSVCAEQELGVKSIDANTLVKILWFKCNPSVASASHLELFFPDDPVSQLVDKVRALLKMRTARKLADEISGLDNYFFSCSSIRRDSQLAKLQRALKPDEPQLRNRKPIGDIVFNIIDKDGSSIRSRIDDILFRVDLDTLRRAAREPQKRVVLVAGGDSKVEVIYVALRTGVANVLITDNVTAERLLQHRTSREED